MNYKQFESTLTIVLEEVLEFYFTVSEHNHFDPIMFVCSSMNCKQRSVWFNKHFCMRFFNVIILTVFEFDTGFTGNIDKT
jgi:hypothetical protein